MKVNNARNRLIYRTIG